MKFTKGDFYKTILKVLRFLNTSCKLTAVLSFLLFSACLTGQVRSESSRIWVGTWSSAQQLVEPGNMPPQPGLNNNTMRQVIRVSIGGDSLRVRFSNEFSSGPLTMKEVQIAASKGGGMIDESTIKPLEFSAMPDATIVPGGTVTSDPVSFRLEPRMDLAITIFFGQVSSDITGHPGSRTTSYLLPDRLASESDLKGSVTTDHWYVIGGVDVKAPVSAGAVAILGNSITDGRGSGTNRQNRWPDILAERLRENNDTRQVAVLNMGIGGNCVLRKCLGPSAIDRFERDILKQQGVKWVIIMEGINDIGQTRDSAAATLVAKDLIAAYGKMIDGAHARGIKIYGATITPFGKSFYYTDFREAARNTVNGWIRSSGRFDSVLDFDMTMRNQEDTLTIKTGAHMGDFLHPNEAGYKLMGDAIDLKLFK